MFINEDIYLAQTWSGPAAKLIMDGHPIQLSVPKEGTYGFVYSLNVVNNAPNADNAYKLPRRDARLAGGRRGDDAPSGFTSTFAGVEKVLNERERAAARAAAGAARARSSSSAGQPRHEERDDRPRGRRGQGGLTTCTPAPDRAGAACERRRTGALGTGASTAMSQIEEPRRHGVRRHPGGATPPGSARWSTRPLPGDDRRARRDAGAAALPAAGVPLIWIVGLQHRAAGADAPDQLPTRATRSSPTEAGWTLAELRAVLPRADLLHCPSSARLIFSTLVTATTLVVVYPVAYFLAKIVPPERRTLGAPAAARPVLGGRGHPHLLGHHAARQPRRGEHACCASSG